MGAPVAGLKGGDLIDFKAAWIKNIEPALRATFSCLNGGVRR